MGLIASIFAALMLLGAPVAFAIGISGFVFFLTSDIMPISIGVQKIATVSQSFPLLAVPFFVLAGHLMNESDITDRLFHFSKVTLGWMSGGLALVSIFLSTLMGGVSGSAVADAAMEARVLGPQMLANRYTKGYTAATIALSSLITATIPPSIGLILYGYVGQVSIGRLFLAGIVPGVLMMMFLMVTAFVIAKKRNYVIKEATKPTLPEMGKAAWEAKWALLFPVLLIISIRGGIFTPSEVGAFAVVYSILIGTIAHKVMTFETIQRAFGQALSDIGMIMLIILMSGMIGFAIIFMQIPQSVAAFLLSSFSEPHIVVGVILIFLLFSGLFFESTILVLLLTPIFVPVIKSAGVDPVHFGILMMTIVTLGSMTPPVGVAMFTVCSLLDVPIDEYIKESLPFLLAILCLVLLLLFVPELVLFLPNWAFG
ncbi:TRAP transporter large permease [Cohaesibacter celericrescens]|uniref:TRAP transporter large permease protein n=1 Tax=Cohaesibacter celericrescens TaxID=2067669 RepID=A0A2N5XMK0_9HYPH|nr:TRAP transporter large permease [Cohaesibacter celericrescens]PLW75723.1 C4-dicarboxylate ABC transporter [Cohaesibacter celericrescens]